MQISFQSSRTARLCGSALAVFLSALLFAADLRSDPYASAWASGQKSSVRLIAGAADQAAGVYSAGVEIRLDPGAITYWRMPGDAGAPPVFSFEGSKNIAGVRILYPAPMRIDEAGAEAFGYREMVTFPLEVRLQDATRPAVLSMDLNYAVCGRICLPAKAAASLALPAPANSTGASSPEERSIAAARAKVPTRLSTVERDANVTLKRDTGTASPTWRMTWRSGSAQNLVDQVNLGAQDCVAQDLFVEAPDGWYFETRKSDHANEFLIVEVEKPKIANAAAVPVTLTLTQARQAYEFAADLDAAAIEP